MFKNIGELGIAIGQDRMFKDKYGSVMKFDPLGKEQCSSPFICKHMHSNEWVVMTGCWLEYETVKEIIPELPDLPDLARDTKVKVAQTGSENFEPHHFKHLDENGNMWCYPDGKNSYTTTTGRATIWKFWRVAEGEHEGTRNFNNNKGNKL